MDRNWEDEEKAPGLCKLINRYNKVFSIIQKFMRKCWTIQYGMCYELLIKLKILLAANSPFLNPIGSFSTR